MFQYVCKNTQLNATFFAQKHEQEISIYENLILLYSYFEFVSKYINSYPIAISEYYFSMQ